MPSRARTFTVSVLLVAGAACGTDTLVGIGRDVYVPLFGAWAPSRSIEAAPPGAHPNFNTAFLDGCPVTSRDGLRFFIASTRPGGLGGIDIWMASRARTSDPWGEPVNVGAPINSPGNDFCPMPANDADVFYFVSNRPGGCGGTDIYVATLRRDVFGDPRNLGCAVNSTADEAGPYPIFEPLRGRVLYFSSTRPGGPAAEPAAATVGDSDLYASVGVGDEFAAPTLVPNVNSEADDGQPSVSAHELYFYSTRAGGLGAADIWVATRASIVAAWGAPTNVGPSVNSEAAETRPSISWDGTTLHFGSTRAGGEGLNDVYVTTRERVQEAERGG